MVGRRPPPSIVAIHPPTSVLLTAHDAYATLLERSIVALQFFGMGRCPAPVLQRRTVVRRSWRRRHRRGHGGEGARGRLSGRALAVFTAAAADPAGVIRGRERRIRFVGRS